MTNPPGPPSSFLLKKSRILQQLSVPISEYDDLSPKGSIDVGIRELIDEINGLERCVTTSSCAGRISVFLEGRRRAIETDGDVNGEVDESGGRESESERTAAGVGGKGGGGRWLFVSHDPVEISGGSCGGKSSWVELLGMQRLAGGDEEVRGVLESHVGERRLVHFKFEPMILHVLTASLQQAQIVLSAALQAGFRESGALNLTSSTSEPPTPMVGIRSMGLALESVIGLESEGTEICMVPEWQLRHLVEVSNQRFVENTKRIERFRALLMEMSVSGSELGKDGKKGENGGEWEDAALRRERKRAEGLRRAEEARQARESNETITQSAEEVLDLNALEQNS
ncbi:methyltransferase TYW3-domain-containing protein [Cadophora sp. MPI-SDFR-AT-0126]|nr:methyltransferase TYW3-domain-containing protein [Leotiomycetes sp. MPI-SDFR-AT-0126]